jgi:hypothetical protein
MRATRLPANSRKYNFGDPVHLIDWRVFARTELLTIKEQQDQASCLVTIVYHHSASMDWPDQEIIQQLKGRGCSKREIAWRVICHMAYQAFRSGDRVRILWVNQESCYQVNIKSQVDVAILFKRLLSSGFNDIPLTAPQSKEVILAHRSDFFFWVSDGLEDAPRWILQGRHGLACWIHTLSSLDLGEKWFDDDHCYFDELSGSREYLGSQLKNSDDLKKDIESWISSVRDKWLSEQRGYLLVTDLTSVRSYLSSLMGVWDKIWRHQEGVGDGNP